MVDTMTIAVGAILVLLERTIFSANVIPFPSEITPVTASAETRIDLAIYCVIRGIGNGLVIISVTANTHYINVTIVVARVVTAIDVDIFVRRHPAVGCMTAVALLRGDKMTVSTLCWLGCRVTTIMASIASIRSFGAMHP